MFLYHLFHAPITICLCYNRVRQSNSMQRSTHWVVDVINFTSLEVQSLLWRSILSGESLHFLYLEMYHSRKSVLLQPEHHYITFRFYNVSITPRCSSVGAEAFSENLSGQHRGECWSSWHCGRCYPGVTRHARRKIIEYKNCIQLLIDFNLSLRGFNWKLFKKKILGLSSLLYCKTS